MTGEGFRYRAATAGGQVQRGWIAAASAPEASATLLARGLSPVELVAAPPPPAAHRAASRHELAVALRSLASLVGAGVPLARAIDATRPLVGLRLGETLAQARQALDEGAPLHAALGAVPGVVPAALLAMLAAGERAGRLVETLDAAATQSELDAELLAQVRGALAYPLLLAVGGGVSVLIIALVVIPRFAVLLADLGQALPPLTRAVLAVSSALLRWGPFLVPALVALGAALLAWARGRAGRPLVHAVLLRLPLVGPVRHALASVRVLRGLSGALASGMPLLPALDAARGAAGDLVIGARIQATAERVLRGESLTAALGATQAVAPAGLQLLAIGERSGELAAMAQRAAALLGRDVHRRLLAAVRVLEPALIVAFGGLIALVAAALLQAVYSLRPAAA